MSAGDPYLLRPPLAQHRVQLRADGRVLVELKTVWRDGTSPLLFEPIEFLHRSDGLKGHTERALANSVTREGNTEIVTHMAFYAGCLTAMTAARIA